MPKCLNYCTFSSGMPLKQKHWWAGATEGYNFALVRIQCQPFHRLFFANLPCQWYPYGPNVLLA